MAVGAPGQSGVGRTCAAYYSGAQAALFFGIGIGCCTGVSSPLCEADLRAEVGL